MHREHVTTGYHHKTWQMWFREYIDQGTFHADQHSHSTHCCHPNESHPLQPHSPAPLVTCMHSHHTTHNPLQTINVLHWTPEGTPIGLVHTHLVTSSGVQLVLINNETHDISMTVLNCTVDQSVPTVVSAVELGLHFGGQVADDIDTATRCSKVQGIRPILQKGKYNK